MAKAVSKQGHRRQVRKSALDRLGQQDLLRQVVGIERADATQLRNHFRGDSLAARSISAHR